MILSGGGAMFDGLGINASLIVCRCYGPMLGATSAPAVERTSQDVPLEPAHSKSVSRMTSDSRYDSLGYPSFSGSGL